MRGNSTVPAPGGYPSRHEYKYIIDPVQKALLLSRLPAVMVRDPHAGSAGVYEVRSLYFDDYRNSCYRDNEDGNDGRVKYRIRIYDGSDRIIHLERKSKRGGMTQKRSCNISREDTEKLIRGESLTWQADWPALLKEFFIWQTTCLAKPRVIVSYRRVPFVHPDGNVRVTLDLDITASGDIEKFFRPVIPGRPVMPAGKDLLEVKFDSFLPDHIHRTVQTRGLSRVTFSKYYLCRKFGGSL